MNATHRPKAYSYARFSHPEQAKGDSLGRQGERARAYAETHGLDLDTKLTFEDLGVSAYRGANVETGRLGEFLIAVQQGIIKPGSYLLIENLDRLSRNKARKGVRLLEDICDAGITVVTTADGKRYDKATLDDDHTTLMYALMVAIRANDESERKSDLVGKAYASKRKRAAEGTENGKPFTRMLPAWLRFNEQTRKHEADPERAAVIQSIFKMADEGLGQHKIAQRLNEQRIPTWGGRGKQRRAECWHRSYVRKLLTNSAVVGTFTPHQKNKDTKKRRPLDPIENYFPAVVERELFERSASRVRTPAARGRNASTKLTSIFAGVLRCAHCGGLVTRVSKGAYVYLVCSKANRKGTGACRYLAVSYKDVESAVRTNARAIIRDAPRGLDTAELDEEIAKLDEDTDVIEAQTHRLADELARDNSGAVRARLREREAELKAALERLRTLRAQRDTRARPYVQRRFDALRNALSRKPLNVVEANKALKEAVGKIVLDPEAGRLAIHWHHAPERPTEGVPFFSKHTEFYQRSKQHRDGTEELERQ
jgi:DNA invertase Pin-like site-specific DNA recombinase